MSIGKSVEGCVEIVRRILPPHTRITSSLVICFLNSWLCLRRAYFLWVRSLKHIYRIYVLNDVRSRHMHSDRKEIGSYVSGEKNLCAAACDVILIFYYLIRSFGNPQSWRRSCNSVSFVRGLVIYAIRHSHKLRTVGPCLEMVLIWICQIVNGFPFPNWSA